MAEAVYVLCALTSLACVVMLVRGYLRTRTPLLVWCALCFACLFANNALLFIDKVVMPEVSGIAGVNFAIWRGAAALLGLALLLFGLIWEAD